MENNLKDKVLAANENFKERDYWLNNLAGELVNACFPYDHKKTGPDDEHKHMEHISFRFVEEDFSKLIKLSKGSDHALHIILTAGTAALVSRYTDLEDIIVGSPIYKQEARGEFINTVLALRSCLHENMTFKELLMQMRETVVNAVENQNYHIDTLLYKLNIEPSQKDFPLFDMFVLVENIHDKSYIRHIKTNLVFSFARTNENLEGTVQYNPARYEKRTVERIIHHFKNLIAAVIREPDLKISGINLLDGKDKTQLLFDFNDTKQEIPSGETYHRLFEEQAGKTPDRIAAVTGREKITYTRLNKDANRIAHYLSNRGVRPGTLIAIYMRRSIDMLAAIIGVFKAGCAYIPLDVDYPASRINYILEHSETPVIITETGNRDTPDPDYIENRGKDKGGSGNNTEILVYNELSGYPETNPGSDFSPDNLAYMIYTSGTTGQPKGVMIHQKGMINHLYGKIIHMHLTADDIIAQSASVSFDISVWQFLVALLNGGKTIIVDNEAVLEPNRLMGILQEEKVTVWESVPSLITVFLEAAEAGKNSQLKHLRWMIFTGESLWVSLVRRWFKRYSHIKIVNAYGPTEASDDITHYFMENPPGENQETIPVGKPLPNLHIYILDKNLSLCPVGVRGEICVAGIGVGLGYWKRPEETARSFVPNPFLDEIKDRYGIKAGDYALVYKTGDIGYFREDGNVECLGRIDHQEKIRGFRIEPGEIENRIREIDFIKETVVISRKNEKGDKYLCAYIVPDRNSADRDREFSPFQVKDYLSGYLPDYMIPEAFVRLDEIPLTPNGKIDRKALPEPETGTTAGYVPPRNKTEEKLTEIWSELLGLEKNTISIDENFYQLGGNSIKTIQINSRITREFGIEISFKDFIQLGTIEKLAGYMSQVKDTGRMEKYPAAIQDLENIHHPFPLSDIQVAYLLGRSSQLEMGGISTHFYNEFSIEIDVKRLNNALDKVIDRHPMMRVIVMDNGQQRILEGERHYEIKVEDLSSLDEDSRMKRILAERTRMSHYMFQPDVWPMFDIKAFKLSADLHHFCIGFDPLIADAFSMEILFKEIVGFYDQPAKVLPEIEFSFRDYMLAYEQLKKSGIYRRDKEYWLSKLDDFPSPPGLPLKCNPTEIKNPRFKGHKKILPKSLWNKLKVKARINNITPSALLCTAYAEVLAYWSNQPELAINLTVFNRYPFHKDVDKIVGDFTSLILLGIKLKPGTTSWERINDVHDTLLEALEHRHYDGVEFIREIAARNNLVNKAVMPIVFTCALFEDNNESINDKDNNGDRLDKEDNKGDRQDNMSSTQTSQVYIDNSVMEAQGELIIYWSFVEELFEARVIDTMFEQYVTILTNLAGGETGNVFQPAGQEKLLLEEFNRTAAPIPRITLPELFRKQVTLTPDHIALEYEDACLTYKVLDEMALRAAGYLRQQGINPGDMVGVWGPRDMEAIINILAISKVGAAYVPVDPEYPEERRNYIIRNSNCKLLVGREPVTAVNIPDIPMDNIIPAGSRPGDIAYVIYTSGSTGKPKGVVITHTAVINTLVDVNERFHVNENHRVMGISSLCFDLSVYDIFGTLSAGARLVIIPSPRDTQYLIKTLEHKKITLWNSVPAIMNLVTQCLDRDYKNYYLETVMLSGDWIPLPLPGKVNTHFPAAETISLGGATEGAIWSIYFPVREVKENWKSIPYGYPLTNQRFYVLNYELDLSPPGVPGALYIGGIGTARGYLNDPGKTHDSFIYHPIWGRLYQTGDYGVFRPGGYIEFLGRKDYQVKISGHRIELGEIENQLVNIEYIKEALVIVKEDQAGDKNLCAYIAGNREIEIPGIKEYLSKSLPGYMIPAFFVQMDKIPLTPNGKVDRKALPEPGAAVGAGEEYFAPGDEVEEKMTEIWSEVLGIEKNAISIDANFFQLGGHSLKAARVVGLIHKELNVKVPLAEIFNVPTIRELSVCIHGMMAEKFASVKAVEKKEYYVVSSAQKRLFVLNISEGKNAVNYNIPNTVLIKGKLHYSRLEETFKGLIRRHESLRTSLVMIDYKPVQIVHDHVDFKIAYSQCPEEKARERAYSFIKPFDLNKAPLMRVELLKIGEDRYLLLVDMHHIIADGISVAVLVKEFTALYRNETLPPLNIQYKDCSEWQHQLAESGKLKKQEEYWLNRFRGDIPVLNMTTDFPRPTVRSTEGDIVLFRIDKELTGKIKELESQTETTLYMILLAVYNILLSKYTLQEDIIVGTPVTGRNHTDMQNIIGTFANMLAMKNSPRISLTFCKFLQEVKENALKAYENQDYQFEELVQNLDLNLIPGRNPLFDVVLNILNVEMTDGNRKGKDDFSIEPFESGYHSSKYDLLVRVNEGKDSIEMSLEYSTALFKSSTIENIVRHYLEILNQVIEDNSISLKDIAISSDLLLVENKSQEEDVAFNF